MLNTDFPSVSSITSSWFCFVQSLLCPSFVCFLYPVESLLLALLYSNQTFSPLRLLGPRQEVSGSVKGQLSSAVHLSPDQWVCSLRSGPDGRKRHGSPYACMHYFFVNENPAVQSEQELWNTPVTSPVCGATHSLQFRQAEKAQGQSPCSPVWCSKTSQPTAA